MMKVQDGELAELPPFGPTANTVWQYRPLLVEKQIVFARSLRWLTLWCLNAWGFSCRNGHVCDGDGLRQQFRFRPPATDQHGRKG